MIGSVIFLFAALAATQASGLSEQVVLSNNDNEYPRLNFSSPSPLIFHSVFGLLQAWSNTFFEFGHTIATGTVPKHTNLYHARPSADAPPNPEWFAFDPEMSYGIFGWGLNCHMYTYRTVRDVKCLYFDGASASLISDGDMDSQMAFIYNSSANIPSKPRWKPSPRYGHPYNDSRYSPPYDDFIGMEYARAKGLCNFIHEHNLGGLGWGYEGIVRMNAGFEMIWCNFSSPSATLVSKINVSAPSLEGDLSSHFLNGPFADRAEFSWLAAAEKRYGFAGGVPQRGETRVKLDSCGVFTLYDPSMGHQESFRVQSEKQTLNLSSEGFWVAPKDRIERLPALEKLGRRRRSQRAMNVSTSDGLYMRHAVENRMRATLGPRGNTTCSGIDWIGITRDIVSIYSNELSRLRMDLSNIDGLNRTETRRQLSLVRGTTHHIYMPYYEYPHFANETMDDDFSVSAPNSQTALRRCMAQYEIDDTTEISPSELLIYTTLSDVLAAICGTMLPVFLAIERTWLRHFNNVTTQTSTYPNDIQRQIGRTTGQNLKVIEELMAWLGWADQWTECSPACGSGQTCYIPMFPIFLIAGNQTGYPPLDQLDNLEKQLWRPRCVDPATFSFWARRRRVMDPSVLDGNGSL